MRWPPARVACEARLRDGPKASTEIAWARLDTLPTSRPSHRRTEVGRSSKPSAVSAFDLGHTSLGAFEVIPRVVQAFVTAASRRANLASLLAEPHFAEAAPRNAVKKLEAHASTKAATWLPSPATS